MPGTRQKLCPLLEINTVIETILIGDRKQRGLSACLSLPVQGREFQPGKGKIFTDAGYSKCKPEAKETISRGRMWGLGSWPGNCYSRILWFAFRKSVRTPLWKNGK